MKVKWLPLMSSLKTPKVSPFVKQPIFLYTAGVTSAANDEVTSSVKKLGDGKYSVSFTPVALVEHVVSVQINGIEVSKSMRI